MICTVLGYLNSNVTPGEYGSALWATVYILVIFLVASVAVMLMTYLERKVLAHMQIRLGPMRVGPHGLLQPIADALKLLIKEDIVPDGADKFLFWMAPVAVMMTGFTTYLVIPFGRTHAVTDMNIGVLFMLGISSLGVLAVVMAGWSSNSKYRADGRLAFGGTDGELRSSHGPGDCQRADDDQPADRHRHDEHDRHRGGAAAAGKLVPVQVLPASDWSPSWCLPSRWSRRPTARPSICRKPRAN